MAKLKSRLGDDSVQEILLDDPDFLRKIIENVVQEILEMEMSNHIGAASSCHWPARSISDA